MKYRVTIGDAHQVRAIVVLEAATYIETESGTLIVYAAPPVDQIEIARWARGHWHSIVDVEQWDRAFHAGVGHENSSRRQSPRSLSQV